MDGGMYRKQRLGASPCARFPYNSHMGRRVVACRPLLLVVAVVGSLACADDVPRDVRPSALSRVVSCLEAATLDRLVACLRDRMPRAGTEEYVLPSLTEMSDFRLVARRMLEGACSDIVLPASLQGIMKIALFMDRREKKPYCVFLEVADGDANGFLDRGFGALVVSPGAVREIVHAAAHPLSDIQTETEAAAIMAYKGTSSRAFLVAGADSRASTKKSACQREYRQSDVAHETTSMFHAATLEIALWYGQREWTHLQWHAMSASTCPLVDVYLSLGLEATPEAGSAAMKLKEILHEVHPDWRVGVPQSDGSPCILNGTRNVQGRVLNGVQAGEECWTPAVTASGRFLHIEQAPGFRDAGAWIPAIRDAWPVSTTSR